MRDIFCSIGKKHIVADIRVDGKHSIDFIDELYQYPNELQERFSQILQRYESINALYLSASFEPAYFLRKEDIPVFRKKNSKQFLYRTLPLSEHSAIIYTIPEIVSKVITEVNIPAYYLPTMEILSRNFQPSENYWKDWDGISLIYLIDEYLYLLFLNKDNKGTSTMFSCENATDVLYYTLLVARENNVKPEKLLTVLGGRGKWMPEAERLIQKYFHEADAYFQTSDHKRYFDLKGLMKCEL